jgi:hypothetical protein
VYIGLLHLHNATRWLVLIAGVAAVALALVGLVTRRPWTGASRGASLAYVISLDVQLVLGVLLYALSPIVRGAMGDVGAAMRDSVARFFLVEHLLLMVLAVVAAHVGSVAVRRAATDQAKYARAATLFGISLVLVLLAIPWWRPLFPGVA